MRVVHYSANFPPAPDFAIQLHAGDESLDLMLDLHNPGWGFCWF